MLLNAAKCQGYGFYRFWVIKGIPTDGGIGGGGGGGGGGWWNTEISITGIQELLNSNKDHFKRNPIFSNKPPLTPVMSKSVQGCNQNDLVYMRSIAVLSNCTEYNYVLSVRISVLDEFSRYLRLRLLLTSWSI